MIRVSKIIRLNTLYNIYYISIKLEEKNKITIHHGVCLIGHKRGLLFYCFNVWVLSCSALSDSLCSHGLTRQAPSHGILQTRIMDWVAIPFSKGSSQPRD